MEFRYSLEKGSKKFICPNCGRKSFTKYVDNKTNTYLSDEIGRCDRENNCGYHNKPSGKNHPITNHHISEPDILSERIDASLLINSITYKDTFSTVLINKYGAKQVVPVLKAYFVGCWNGNNPYYKDWTIFWRVDPDMNIHTGKIMKYRTSLKREKYPDGGGYVSWVHKLTKQNVDKPASHLFGAHLLKDNRKPIVIVESEKSAILGAIIYPDKLWLASGGIDNLKPDNLSILNGKPFTVYPDSEQESINKWTDIITASGGYVNTNYLDNCTDEELASGFDIADFILKYKIQPPVKTGGQLPDKYTEHYTVNELGIRVQYECSCGIPSDWCNIHETRESYQYHIPEIYRTDAMLKLFKVMKPVSVTIGDNID